jgi:lipoyl synthase
MGPEVNNESSYLTSYQWVLSETGGFGPTFALCTSPCYNHDAADACPRTPRTLRQVWPRRTHSMTTRFPEWIRQKWASGGDFSFTKDLVTDLGLRTVCQSARCPNLGECWQRRTATFMVLGGACTRNCRFCSVPGGAPAPPDPGEPAAVAEAVKRMGLRHMVLTSVTRDDLPDGGAWHIAETVRVVRAANPETTTEVLVPDFQGDRAAIATVLEAGPDVFGHNIETVESLYPQLRDPGANYAGSLEVLRAARALAPEVIVKSALMVGHGETPEEVRQTLADLREAGCEAVCIGQYLRPSKAQRAVVEFVHPDQFAAYQEMAHALGFGFAVAGPFVRSSYRSDEMMDADFARERKKGVGSAT